MTGKTLNLRIVGWTEPFSSTTCLSTSNTSTSITTASTITTPTSSVLTATSAMATPFKKTKQI